MGIRYKLLLPLVALGLSFAALLHLYWLPQFRASETAELQKRELATMDVAMAALMPSLLTGDLAQIHITLDQLLERQHGWKAIHLKAADDRYLYPVLPSPAAQLNATGQWLTFPADFEGKQIATLELNIDTDAMLASQLGQIRILERMILLIVFSITMLAALLQDSWIRRPLKTLAAAASYIAHGDYKITLPKVSTRDEVGKLIAAFDSMRVNLANREKKLSEQYALLNTIHAAQARFIRDTDANALFNRLLVDILELTDSEYGYIGEVLYRDDEPYLETFVICNRVCDDETRQYFDEHASRGAGLTSMQMLSEAVLTGNKPVIVNDPAGDARVCDLPDGHPPLNAFMGIPFLRDDKVIGMFGVANRPAGYDKALIEHLQPVTSTCSHIVEALKAERHRVQAEELLREREIRMRAIFENVVDGIITTNDRGIIESFNQASEQMFGYTATEVIGSNVSMLIPTTHQKQHDKYIDRYLDGAKSKIVGVGREVEGLRKDGTTFPVDIAINVMWVGEERIFCSIMRDITERKKIDRMKNEFVSTVSHELRTPLTSIRGSLGLLTGGAVGELPTQASSLLEIAGNNTERLLLLINDILDIEKIESGQMAFRFENVEVRAFLDQALEANEAYASQHNI